MVFCVGVAWCLRTHIDTYHISGSVRFEPYRADPMDPIRITDPYLSVGVGALLEWGRTLRERVTYRKLKHNFVGCFGKTGAQWSPGRGRGWWEIFITVGVVRFIAFERIERTR